MSRIFISHSHKNNPAADAIERWLEENGWDDVYLDINPAKGISPASAG